MRLGKTFPRSGDDCAIMQRTFLYNRRILSVICYIVIKNFKRPRCQDNTGASAVWFLTFRLPKGIAAYPTNLFFDNATSGHLAIDKLTHPLNSEQSYHRHLTDFESSAIDFPSTLSRSLPNPWLSNKPSQG